MFYINKILCKYDIIILQETWIEDKNSIEDYLFEEYDIKIYEVKATRDAKTGRPKGGLAFLVKSNIKSRFYKVSNNVAYITIKGVMIATDYLPVDAKHYEFNFTLEINRLKLVLKDYIKTHDVYVVGDFNTEFTRQRSSNTTSLRKLMREFGLTAGDMNGRLFNFTYYKGDKTSHLDHILHARMNPRVENIEIVRDEDNNSDHLAIELTIETRVDLKKNNKTTKMVNPKPQWKNNQFLERYNFVLDAEKHEICDCMTELKYAIENKEHVDDLHAKLHKKLHELLRKATEEALKLCCNKSFKDKNKRKNWYSKEIIELNKIVTQTRREFESNPNMHTKLAVKGISKVLRREVRNSKTAARRRETNDLDSLRTNNIDRFWRRVKEKLTTKTTVEAGISELKDDFENLFTSKIASESAGISGHMLGF